MNIFLVGDGSPWSITWDVHYLTSELNRQGSIRVQESSDPWRLRNSMVHFANRFAFLHGPFQTFDPSNIGILTWFHGSAQDQPQYLKDTCDRMIKAAPYLQTIVVSCAASKHALLELGIPEEKIVTVPLGVDLARFALPNSEQRAASRKKLGIPEDAVVIGSFQKDGLGWGAGLEPKWEKGPDVFLDVVAKIYRQKKNLFVLLAGPARGFVKRGLDALGVPYYHEYLSDYHDINHFYHALDVYLITARTEGGPKGLLESWATGVPVVSSRVGMALDHIRDRENGMLADVDDAHHLAEDVMTVIENDELRVACVQKALQAVAKFDWSRVAYQYGEHVYRPLLQTVSA